MNHITNNDLIKYEILELIGIHTYDQNKKQKFYDECNRMILGEFILFELSNTDNEENINTLKKLTKQKLPYDQLFNKVVQLIPDFHTQLFNYSLEWKVRYIFNYFSNILDGLYQNLISLTQESAIKIVRKDIEKYKIALQLTKNKDWEKLFLHFKKESV